MESIKSGKVLTIAIPTYNRADFLRTQLTVIAQQVIGFEDECEIFVSDNCSTDKTMTVLEEFQSRFKPGCFRFWKNPENIGAIRNIAHCINTASGNHVWVCSDDDELCEGAIANIVNNLKASPNAGLLFLNYTIYSIDSGNRLEKWSDQEQDEEYADGKSKLEEILATPYGWEALTVLTATVFRTDLAQRSISTWEDSVNSVMLQLYIIGFCTFYGSLRTTKDSYFEYIMGRSFYQKPAVYFKMHYLDTPKVFLKLQELGYNSKLCQSKGLDVFSSFQDWVGIFKSLVKRPLPTFRVLKPSLSTVVKILLLQ